MASPEFEDYRKQKEQERARQEQPAKAEHDPEWEKRRHLDPLRGPAPTGRHGEPHDAEGQAERGSIDQQITNKGRTQTR